MKKKYNLMKTCIVVIFMTLAACQDLTEDPKGFVSPENFYSTVAQGEAALTASMNELWDYWGGYSYGYGFFVHDDQLLGGNLNITEGFANAVWDMHYRALKNINGVLRSVDKGSIKGVPQSEIDGLIGQAKFLRAYNYFMLVRLYGDLPLITEDTPDPVTNPVTQRTPVAEVYNSIVSDFEDAIVKLPSAWDGQPGKPTRGAAKGLLAKVYLTMATAPLNQTSNYAKARDLAADVMDDGTYSLVPNVGDVFKLENKFGPEMMFSFNSTYDDPATDGQIWTPEVMDGWGDASIDPTWSDKWLTTSPGEPRQAAYLILEYNGVPYTAFDEQRPFIRKFSLPYITAEDYETAESTINYPIIRFADVLLIYAEAANMAEGGPSSEAYEAVNMVRRRANNLPLTTPDAAVDLSGLSKSAFDAAIIEERNHELCFEYDRWFDLVRKRMLEQVAGQYIQNVSDEDYLYPIPNFDARKLNSQNPGYTTE